MLFINFVFYASTRCRFMQISHENHFLNKTACKTFLKMHLLFLSSIYGQCSSFCLVVLVMLKIKKLNFFTCASRDNFRRPIGNPTLIWISRRIFVFQRAFMCPACFFWAINKFYIAYFTHIN